MEDRTDGLMMYKIERTEGRKKSIKWDERNTEGKRRK